MPRETALIGTIAAGLGLAFVFGFAATKLRLPALVGYLVAGILVGPFSPGFVADADLAAQLAEVGVILLMFGVGMHFSVRDLLAVWHVAVPGAIVRMALITGLTMLVAHAWGWTWGASVVFGIALSVASTIVLLRALEERGILTSVEGRIAVGWLIVEDLAMVIVLVLLPAIVGSADGGATPRSIAVSLGITLAKVAVFVLVMLIAGSRLIPRMLAAVARVGSRELFTLSVLATALCIALGAARLFGVSFALGAFLAGVVIAESDLSHQAAAEALPLQDAFAVLFFVSVGMVFDPRVLIERPVAVVVAASIAIVAKLLVSFALVLRARYPMHTALSVAAGVSQVGEFSFILAQLGLTYGVLPAEGQSLILAAAIISITLNPLAFAVVRPLSDWMRRHPSLVRFMEAETLRSAEVEEESGATGHVILVGYGRVGTTIGQALAREGIPFLVIDSDRMLVEHLRKRGLPAIFGDASRPGVLEHARVTGARMLVIAAPGAYQTRATVDAARRLNPGIDIVVRTHSAAEQQWLEERNVGTAVMGERELALGMARYALGRSGVDAARVEQLLESLRGRSSPASG
jgi:CPA2 family monovalent cation:H+ antiporter-2